MSDLPPNDELHNEQAAAQPNVQVMLPERLQLHISLEGMPDSVSELFQRLAKPTPKFTVTSIFKDYLPVLTPIASGVIAFLIAYYGGKFDDRLTRETVDKIATDIVDKKDDPNIAAMKIAAYGDKALPAVRVVLGANTDTFRQEGELIVQQMYVDETVNRRKLLDELMHDYDNPVLRLGVLEALNKMALQLEEPDREPVLSKLTDPVHGFGSDGRKCKQEESDKPPFEAASVLLKWSPVAAGDFLQRSKDIALGLTENCLDNENPQRFDRVRTTAANAAARMAKSFPRKERAAIAASLRGLAPNASSGLAAILENDATEVDKIEGP